MDLVSLKKFFELVTYPDAQPMNEVTRFIIATPRDSGQNVEISPKETT